MSPVETDRRRRFWGWGYEDEGPDPQALAAAEAGLRALLPDQALAERPAPELSTICLPPPRVPLPSSRIFTEDRYERALHCYGRSYRDLIRALDGDFRAAPDLVAFPESEADIEEVLELCARRRLALIPFGGGTSVCGGVEAAVGPTYSGSISLDLRRMNRVLEVDPISRAARIQAGALGPALEAQLAPEGLSLRHYPQSFAFSTLGGWIATRSGGHFATLCTHIDEMVESLRLLTPRGPIETRRLPASGAGPAPERLFIGSEGALGIITEAWMRVRRRPRFRASATFSFSDFLVGASFVKNIAQSELYPANCRLLDPLEAMMNGAGSGEAVAIVAFESDDHPLDPWLDRAIVCGADHGARITAKKSSTASAERPQGEGADARWRAAFLRAPYLRDALVRRGLLVETFETAITWDRFPKFVEQVRAATLAAATEQCGAGLVSCRLTHAYPDGVAPYFTVVAPGRRGAELAQWAAIKGAATAAILAGGGTTTHHHAVGRDFLPFYQQEQAPGFGRALAAVKRELDPDWLLNPGALLSR